MIDGFQYKGLLAGALVISLASLIAIGAVRNSKPFASPLPISVGNLVIDQNVAIDFVVLHQISFDAQLSSVFEIPALHTRLIRIGDNRFLWFGLNGEKELFEKGKIAIGRSDATLVEDSSGVFIKVKSLRLKYLKGRLTEIETKDGRRLTVQTTNGRIKSFREMLAGEDSEVLSVKYTTSGLPKEINANHLFKTEFVYNDGVLIGILKDGKVAYKYGYSDRRIRTIKSYLNSVYVHWRPLSTIGRFRLRTDQLMIPSIEIITQDKTRS